MLFGLLFSALCAHAAEPPGAALLGVDLHGQPIHALAAPGERLVVLIFAASDCPISNRYIPVIANLNQEFGPHGVHFWWVFPNPEDTASIVARHDQDYAIHESVLLDTHQTLVRESHATITPESALFRVTAAGMREIYHGRIDDRYLAIGQERPQPRRRELEAAIAAALAGKPVAPPAGPPVGCAIVPLQP